MSDAPSQRSVASSAWRQRDAELTAAEEGRRAMAQAAVAAARAARLAAAELAAARAEVEAEEVKDAAHAAEVKVDTLHGSLSGSITGDTTADGDLEELERERAWEQTMSLNVCGKRMLI